MISYVNFIKVIVLLTFIYALFKLDKSKKVHILVLVILLINFLNETLSSLLRYYNVDLKVSSSCYIFLHTLLWLKLLGVISRRKKTTGLMIAIYIVFAICNALWIDGLKNFNAFTMILGAFLYVLFFIIDCYAKLKAENLQYFSSDEYVLTTVPILFLVGFSILFGFRQKVLHQTEWHGITLFMTVCYFINIIYYLLVNLYIYKESQRK